MKGKAAPRKKQARKKKIKDFVSWFEIPALNFDRAVTFYNHIYDIEMDKNEMHNYMMAFFPANKGVGGAIVMGEGSYPSDSGPLIYLNGGDDLDTILSRIEDAGGRILMPKTLIDDDSGYFALFIDSEGNRLALHSKK